MTRAAIFFLWASALALGLVAPALAADVGAPYSQGPGGYYRKDDRSGPYAVGSDGVLRLIAPGASTSSATGSQELDIRGTGTLAAGTASSSIIIPVNGQATVGLTFTGLTASAATVTYEQSNDGGTTYTGINEVNAGTGVPAATRTTDGQTRVSVSGRTNLRLRVTTTGTGTIQVAWTVSVREGLVTLASPLPPGTNNLGFAAPPPSASIAVQRTTAIGTTGVQVSASDPTNRRTVINNSSVACEIMGSAAAYGTGYPLPAGTSFTFDSAGRTTAALFVACASATGSVAVLSY